MILLIYCFQLDGSRENLSRGLAATDPRLKAITALICFGSLRFRNSKEKTNQAVTVESDYFRSGPWIGDRRGSRSNGLPDYDKGLWREGLSIQLSILQEG
jgi:hypothetical protein